MVTNNLVEFIPSENAFELLEDIAIQISGYIGYIANTTNPGPTGTASNNGSGNDMTIINASIQVKFNGNSLYENYSSVRGVYTANMSAYRQTLNIPPAMLIGHKGDRIRMVVIPQPVSSAGTAVGIAHAAPAVVTPFGSDFCKSLKITAE